MSVKMTQEVGRQRYLADALSCLEEVLDLTVAWADLNRPLRELGFESFAAVRLRRRLRERTGADLPIAAFLGDASTASVLKEVTQVVERSALSEPARTPGTVSSAAADNTAALGADSVTGNRSEADVSISFALMCLATGLSPTVALVATVGVVMRHWTGASAFSVGTAADEVPLPDPLTWGGLVRYTRSISGTAPCATPGDEFDITCTVAISGGSTISARGVRRPGGARRVVWHGAGSSVDLVAGMAQAHAALLVRLSTELGSWTDPALCWDPTGHTAEPSGPVDAGRPLLADPLRASAQRFGDRTAVVDATGSTTHRVLADLSSRTTQLLQSLGVGRTDQVALACSKDARQIATAIGITESGAAYVPVDPSWPPARIAAVCMRAGVRHALVAPEIRVSFPPGVQIHPIQHAEDIGHVEGMAVIDSSVASIRPVPTDPAYTIFTSGSSGAPKGVTVEHSAARTTIDEINRRFGVVETDKVLALSALSFDLSVYDIFGVLGAGGTVVLPNPAIGVDPQHWLDLVSAEGVTVWNSVPALLDLLVEHAEEKPDESRRALKTLRLALVSGDWIPVALPDRLRQLAPHVAIVSLGGATEAAIWSICYPIGHIESKWTSIPYGRPLRGHYFYILDADQRPCPVGRTGELYIGGAGLARGYIGDPDLTQTRFAAHPITGQRLYRTGDLGRWGVSGDIEFLGRVDRQVKINGNRIELGEIESVLHRVPSVGRCVASVSRTADGRSRLVAHVSPRHAGGELELLDLLNILREHLPAYMVPARLMSVSAFPVTPNGKIDISRLPNPFAGPANINPSQ